MPSKDSVALCRQWTDDYVRGLDAAVPTEVRRNLLAGALSALGGAHLTAANRESTREIDRLAVAVSSDDLEAIFTSATVKKLEKRLKDFVHLSEQNGDDVTLLEPEEEEVVAVEEGRRLLMDRDDIECLIEGVRLVIEHRPKLRRAVQSHLKDATPQLQRLDKHWKPHIRHFLAFNAFRRAFRNNRPEAERFWWWHLRADCDLQAVYRAAGGGGSPVHVQSCDDCSVLVRELSAAATELSAAHGLPRVHPEPDALVRLFHGESSGGAEEWAEWHVRTCDSCRSEMEALQRADEVDLQVGATEVRDEGVASDEDAQQAASLDVSATPAVSQPVLYRFSLAQDAGAAFVADTEDGVGGLPGRKIYRDRHLDVWMKEENGRVVVRVYGERDLEAGSTLVVAAYDTGRRMPVTVLAREPKKHEFDIGSVGDLAGKRLSLAFGAEARRTALGIVDFVREP